MSAVRNHPARTLAVCVAALLILLFWKVILAAAGCLFVLSLLRRHLYGGAGGRRSTLASTITAVSTAYTAWNSRWLKPTEFTAKVHKSAESAPWER